MEIEPLLEELLQFHQHQLLLWSKRLDCYERMNSRLDQLLRPWPIALTLTDSGVKEHQASDREDVHETRELDKTTADHSSESASAELVSEVDRLLAKANSVIAAKPSASSKTSARKTVQKLVPVEVSAPQRVSNSANNVKTKPPTQTQIKVAPIAKPKPIRPAKLSSGSSVSYKPAHVTAPFRTDPNLHRRVAINQQYKTAGRNRARVQAAEAAAEAARPARLVGQWLGNEVAANHNKGRISKSAETANSSSSNIESASVNEALPVQSILSQPQSARRSLSADNPVPNQQNNQQTTANNPQSNKPNFIRLRSVIVPEPVSLAVDKNRRLRQRLSLALSNGKFDISQAAKSFTNRLKLNGILTRTKPETVQALTSLLSSSIDELDRTDPSLEQLTKIRQLYKFIKSIRLNDNFSNKDLFPSALTLADLPVLCPLNSTRCLALSAKLPALIVQADLSYLLLRSLKKLESKNSLILSSAAADPVALRQLWALAGGGVAGSRSSWATNGRRPHLPVTISTVP